MLRKKEEALKNGDLEILDTDCSSFAFCRKQDDDVIIVIANMDSKEKTFCLDGSYENIVSKETYDSTVKVGALCAAILKKTYPTRNKIKERKRGNI